MVKLVYKAPASEDVAAVTAEFLAESVSGDFNLPDMTEETFEW